MIICRSVVQTLVREDPQAVLESKCCKSGILSTTEVLSFTKLKKPLYVDTVMFYVECVVL